ncbi:MAG: cryptochrome/photolyase family protein [Bacteroidia bacterium]|nr:cryptochrome/photolyase family protein [Bacteroidia bacterium]
MNVAAVLFPHQLFENSPLFHKKIDKFYIVEEFLFFKQFKFHKTKLAYHITTMKFYADFLSNKGYSVDYVYHYQPESDLEQLITHIANLNYQKLIIIDPTDDWLEQKFIRSCQKHRLIYEILDSPMFIYTISELKEYCDNKQIFHQTSFYIYTRKKLGILIDKQSKPLYGKWSFDTQNRKKIPKNIVIPKQSLFYNSYWKSAAERVNNEFPNNYGNIGSESPFPLNFQDAYKQITFFINEKLSHFGDYQDAISFRDTFLFHSNLSAAMNIGLITPKQLLNALQLEVSKLIDKVGINNLEGFIRQIIGWREYIRMIYVFKGRKQRSKNYFNNAHQNLRSFLEQNTNILPVDIALKKNFEFAYNHHIERLMLIGNLMLLLRIHPDKVYEFFMSNYIDAYDWVMVPNVYGMSQFADGGVMSTKPYIAGSNYVLKMSSLRKDSWCNLLNALFWRFIYDYRNIFIHQPRLNVLVKNISRMNMQKIIQITDEILKMYH